MKKTIMYKYLGTNGVIISPIHLEDVYYIRLIQLQADDNKVLTNGIMKKTSVMIPEEELNLWKEIDQ
jgi:hypothetical protein